VRERECEKDREDFLKVETHQNITDLKKKKFVCKEDECECVVCTSFLATLHCGELYRLLVTYRII